MRVHPDTARKMAKAGEVPATKIGRAWVFSSALLQQWIDERCRSTNVPVRLTGGSALAARLAARLEQQTVRPRKSSRKSSQSASGVVTSSTTVVPFPGGKRPSAG
ncbi:MAG: helix-turn-helix domain-containing protein [Betaproteobacteria bacterium]|nr:helix-turn-helix domain-containing protein [Betaproteobacteria bacterium]